MNLTFVKGRFLFNNFGSEIIECNDVRVLWILNLYVYSLPIRNAAAPVDAKIELRKSLEMLHCRYLKQRQTAGVFGAAIEFPRERYWESTRGMKILELYLFFS